MASGAAVASGPEQTLPDGPTWAGETDRGAVLPSASPLAAPGSYARMTGGRQFILFTDGAAEGLGGGKAFDLC